MFPIRLEVLRCSPSAPTQIDGIALKGPKCKISRTSFGSLLLAAPLGDGMWTAIAQSNSGDVLSRHGCLDLSGPPGVSRED